MKTRFAANACTGHALAVAGLAFWLSSCTPPPIQNAWRHYDLWEHAPTILRPAAERPEPFRGELDSMQGRAIRVLNPLAGEVLSWKIDLADSPSLTVRTIAEGGRCWFHITAKADGETHELLRTSDLARGRNIAPEVGIDLGSFAGQSIELTFEVGPDEKRPCRQARWGSPRIADRTSVPAPHRDDRPNLIFLGIDTLRADALGAYGRSPSVSPTIDFLANHSDVWLNAFTSSNNTNPSFISLMTGLYAKNHGIFNLMSGLADSYTTLAEALHGAGYETFGIAAATHLSTSAGLAQGFDTLIGPPRGQFFAETVVDRALNWLAAPKKRPFFLFLHMFDAHVPHNPPARYHLGLRPDGRFGPRPVDAWTPFREVGGRKFDRRPKLNISGHVDLYPGEVAYLDRQLDRLFAYLSSRGIADNSVIVLVADHGETLGERGNYFDHVGLHDNTTHIPLIIHWPGQTKGRRIEGLVQHLDLFPTLLRYLDVQAPANDGRDLIAMREEDRGRRLVFAHHANDSGAMVRGPRFKYIVNQSDPLWDIGPYFYDLEADPNETNNLAGQGWEQEAEMATLLQRWRTDRQTGDAPVAMPITEDDRKRLEALGYSN